MSDHKKWSNDDSEGAGLSVELGKIVREIRETWFEKTCEDWGPSRQVFFTFMGSLTFFFSSFVVYLSVQKTLFSVDIYPVLVFLIFIFSAFFGWILAWTPRNTGPVRLYLSGLALSGFVTFIITIPWRIWGAS